MQVGNLVVDVCQDGCGGIWFDAFELQRVDEQEEEAGERLLNVRRDERIAVDPTRKRECPRCDGIKLHRHFFSAKRRIEVDECPNCGGYWLDAGELAQIRSEKSETAQDATERAAGIPGEVIRYLYRLRAGERKTP
jgi:Zn-finger nucleic acid-binding protein